MWGGGGGGDLWLQLSLWMEGLGTGLLGNGGFVGGGTVGLGMRDRYCDWSGD